jgi:hypothetical protein
MYPHKRRPSLGFGSVRSHNSKSPGNGLVHGVQSAHPHRRYIHRAWRIPTRLLAWPLRGEVHSECTGRAEFEHGEK